MTSMDNEREAGSEVEAARLADMLAGAGFPRMAAKALCTLLTSETGALTSAEVQQHMKASAGAVSQAMQALQLYGLVTRSRVPHSRKVLWELGDDPWASVLERESPLYDQLAEQQERLVRVSTPAARARLERGVRFYRFLGRRMPELLAEWRAVQESDEGAATHRVP